MDQPGLDLAAHARALRGLGRINRWSRSDSILWPTIARLAREAGRAATPTPIRLLDLACGGGDLPIGLARRAARAGLDIRVEGCDISAQAVEYARRQAEARGVAVRFFRLDALNDALPADYYDVVSCSLFLHHLEAEDAVALLRRMATAARRLVLVNDLIRSRRGYLLAWVGCRLLSRSPIVHEDGPVSVAGAFTPVEVLELAGRAGLGHATLTKRWPQRFLLVGGPR